MRLLLQVPGPPASVRVNRPSLRLFVGVEEEYLVEDGWDSCEMLSDFPLSCLPVLLSLIDRLLSNEPPLKTAPCEFFDIDVGVVVFEVFRMSRHALSLI